MAEWSFGKKPIATFSADRTVDSAELLLIRQHARTHVCTTADMSSLSA